MSYIHIDMPKASNEYAQKCRQNMAILFEQGFFDFKKGQITVSFDAEGRIGSVEKQLKWRRDDAPSKSLPTLEQNVRLNVE